MYSQVQNNEHMSEEFFLERGVRQGFPLSFPLCCAQNDVFSYDILKDEKIKGFNIPVRKENLKLSQYADDTSFLSHLTFRAYPYFLINFQNTKKLQDVPLMPIKQKAC